MNYFDKIPTITYNNMLCKNLMAHAKLSDNIRDQKQVFYPYTMDGMDRADILSNDYYDSPGYTWLIWLTNNIIDPYYGMPLSEDDFNQYIVNKYGSYELASRKIAFYRNNWYDHTDDTITTTAFNSLTASEKKYYEPVLDMYLNVSHYKRKREDFIVNTNKVETLNISAASGTFTVGEEVQIDANNYAFVTFSNTSVVSVQHINGTLATGTITGQESNKTATVNSVDTISTTLAYDDVTFWSPVSYFDSEHELNEVKKRINLLDPRFAKQAENDLRRIMSST